jgi:ankyrin repeat protein
VLAEDLEIQQEDAAAQSANRRMAFFYVAAMRGHTEEFLARLNDAPELLNCTRPDGATALMIASEYGQLSIVRQLLAQEHLDLAAMRTPDGATALHLAAAFGNLDIVKAILERPEAARLTAQKNRSGQTAAEIARKLGFNDISSTLDLSVDRGRPALIAFCAAARDGHTDEVARLLEREPALLNESQPSGYTALMFAVVHGQGDVVRQLLAQEGVEVATARKSDGATALHIAALRGDMAVVEAILNRPEARELAVKKDRWGSAAISWAAELGHLGVVEALRQFAHPAPRVFRLPKPRPSPCRIFSGPEIGKPGKDWNSVACLGPRPFQPQIFTPDSSHWEDLAHSVRSDPEAASHWLIRAHGSAGARFGLKVTVEEPVPITEVIRLLIEKGVDTIDVWACRAEAAVTGLEMRIAHDPHWPECEYATAVTFHGEGAVQNSGTVDLYEIEESLRALANPERPRDDLMCINSRTTLVRHGDGRSITRYSLEPEPYEIAKRLGQLPDDAVRKRLVLNYMSKSLYGRRSLELANSLQRFGVLADPNSALPGTDTTTLLDVASYFGWLDMMEVILNHPGTALQGPGQTCSLGQAAAGGHLDAVERLLHHPGTTAAHVAQACTFALKPNLKAIHDVLTRWKQPGADA